MEAEWTKDSDERILADGFYRHAENIIILDSEGADVGAVQNSLSNVKITKCKFRRKCKNVTVVILTN